jgi:hypothetical protein
VMSSAVLMALAMHTRVCLQPAVGMKQQHTWHTSCVKAKESVRPLCISPLQ